MESLLLADGFDWATSWPIFLLIGALAALFIFQIFAGKKNRKQAAEMQGALKVGDKVVTNAGVYGEIVSMEETNFGRVVLLKTGEGDKISYMSINASVILGIDVKKPVVLDANGNIIDDTAPAAAKEEPAKVPESNPDITKKKPAKK